MTRELILQAVARGWCSPENSSKEMDGSLAAAIADEVEKAVQEHHAMKLAAISVACLQNTRSSIAERIDASNPYWTVAYGDVCAAVDREIAQRELHKRIFGIIKAHRPRSASTSDGWFDVMVSKVEKEIDGARDDIGGRAHGHD